MVGDDASAEVCVHAAEQRLSLRLLSAVVGELSEELKRGSFHSQCCNTIYLLSSSLSAAADEARRPPNAAADAVLHPSPLRSQDAEMEVQISTEEPLSRPPSAMSNFSNCSRVQSEHSSRVGYQRSHRESFEGLNDAGIYRESNGISRLSRDSLLRVFHDLDQNCSGCLDSEELRAALVAAGMPQAHTQKILHDADTDGDGEIDYSEWKAAADGLVLEIKELAMSLRQMSTESRKTVFKTTSTEDVVSSCMLWPDSTLRLVWDLGLALLCIYVALVLPFTTGFSYWILHDYLRVMDRLELAVDVFFLIDVCFNFRTGIMRENGSVVMDARRVAWSYVKSWFVLDLCSSIPFSELTSGSVSSVRALKLLKLPKLLKAVRVIKTTVMAESQLAVFVQETLPTRFVRTMGRRGAMLFLTLLLCHWLACLMAFTSTAWLSDYFARRNQAEQLWSIYVAALYWAMTAMTTVGWGDITPTNDLERGYVIVAMVLGGAYYGYAVGTLISIINNRDLNASAYHDRMEAIFAWLDHHKLPKDVRRRVIRYFKLYLSEKAAVKESDVVNDMSPSLRTEVGTLIVHKDIQQNPVFDNVPMNAVIRLQPFVNTIHMEEGSIVVREGEAGTSMFIINEGMARQVFSDQDHSTMRPRILGEGDSFGEEILSNVCDRYCYTVVVIKRRARMFVIEEVSFRGVFEHMPDIMDQVAKNTMQLKHLSSCCQTGRGDEQVQSDYHRMEYPDVHVRFGL